MSVFALFGIVAFQAGGTFEDVPRVPDRKVTTYEVTCKGTYAQISFAEDFTMVAGNESIVRTVTLLNLGRPAPKASYGSVSALFKQIALVKSVVTSCKGNAAWFVVDYISQNDFREVIKSDVPGAKEQAPVGRLYLTVTPTGSILTETSVPRKR